MQTILLHHPFFSLRFWARFQNIGHLIGPKTQLGIFLDHFSVYRSLARNNNPILTRLSRAIIVEIYLFKYFKLQHANYSLKRVAYVILCYFYFIISFFNFLYETCQQWLIARRSVGANVVLLISFWIVKFNIPISPIQHNTLRHTQNDIALYIVLCFINLFNTVTFMNKFIERYSKVLSLNNATQLVAANTTHCVTHKMWYIKRYVSCHFVFDAHWENNISISFQIEWDMIVVTVFLSIFWPKLNSIWFRRSK